MSFARDVRPLLRRHCESCHKPEKLKGGLDVTAHRSLIKGGETGPGVVAGDPGASLVLESVAGPDPEMPQKGEPLEEGAVSLLRRWIAEGAADDSGPESGGGPGGGGGPPVYRALPVVTALTFTPDGSHVALSGHGEILFQHADGSGLAGRLRSGLPRVEALWMAGSRLVACGGLATEFGGFEMWEGDAPGALVSGGTHRVAGDVLFGLSLSPDGRRVAFGSADQAVRVADLDSGEVVATFSDHSGWSMGTVFGHEGIHVVTASRDETMRLVDAATGAMIDTVNKNPREPVFCIARHPTEPWCLAGGENGGLFAYTIPEGPVEENEQNRDPNFRAEFDRMPGPVFALAFSADGTLVAAAGAGGEVRVFKSADRSRAATIRVEDGTDIYALAFSPQGARLAFAGYSGTVRVAAIENGEVVAAFGAAPVE